MLVVVFQNDELAEVLSLMTPPRGSTSLARWKHQHGQLFILGLLGGVCTAATRNPDDLLGAALQELKPEILVNAGVAFGRKSASRHKLGDILVPKNVLLHDANHHSHGTQMAVDPRLHRALEDTEMEFRIDCPEKKQYSVHTETLVSSLADLSSQNAMRDFLDRFSDAVGVYSEVTLFFFHVFVLTVCLAFFLLVSL